MVNTCLTRRGWYKVVARVLAGNLNNNIIPPEMRRRFDLKSLKGGIHDEVR